MFYIIVSPHETYHTEFYCQKYRTFQKKNRKREKTDHYVPIVPFQMERLNWHLECQHDVCAL